MTPGANSSSLISWSARSRLLARFGWSWSQARYYDPDIGRFVSVDPEALAPGELFLARYAYAENNPSLYIDPDGRQSCVGTGCTVGPTPYSSFRDNAVGKFIGQTIGDPIALARNNNIDPITSEVLDKGQIAEAKLAILTLAVPASRGEALAADVAKEGVVVVRGFTAHAVDRAIDRSIKPSAILDAVRNPLKITETKIDLRAGPVLMQLALRQQSLSARNWKNRHYPAYVIKTRGKTFEGGLGDESKYLCRRT